MDSNSHKCFSLYDMFKNVTSLQHMKLKDSNNNN